MVKIGILFPGQGAQFVGMGKEWAAEFSTAVRVYEQADKILGVPISRYCFEGPEDTLTRTLYAQPAIFVTSLALYSVLQEKTRGLKADLVAGLSLGEFTALVAAGALTFSEGLKLVQKRAEFMEKSAERNPGTMVSILGLNQEECEAISRESGSEIANLNALDQFVLSGKEAAVAKAAELAEGMGAKKVIHLKVGGAFHSSLMRQAKAGLEESLKQTLIQRPRNVFIPNVTAREEDDPERIRSLLGEQLISPVRWIQTMERARGLGIRRFIEIGPGRVLKGLAKRISSSLEVFSFERLTDLGTTETILERV